MKRVIAGVVVGVSLIAAGTARAQEAPPGPGKAEVTIIPAGWTFFPSKGQGPKFGGYEVGGTFEYNFNRLVGVEGEVGAAIGKRQDLDLTPVLTVHEKTPNILSYSGNVVYHAPFHSVVPYATGGIGATTVSERELLGIFKGETFLTGNVGGGVKWYAPGGRWGLRGDYRFQATRSKEDAPEFFGRDNRFSHRLYAAVVINAIK